MKRECVSFFNEERGIQAEDVVSGIEMKKPPIPDCYYIVGRKYIITQGLCLAVMSLSVAMFLQLMVLHLMRYRETCAGTDFALEMWYGFGAAVMAATTALSYADWMRDWFKLSEFRLFCRGKLYFSKERRRQALEAANMVIEKADANGKKLSEKTIKRMVFDFCNELPEWYLAQKDI